jgi:hypothetical protein
VSSGVARKEHGEFSSNIDLIDTLPPGLYEAVFEQKGGDLNSPDLVTGDWVMRCELRTLDDIRALGGNDAADERRFATAARVSEINLSLYRTFAQPIVRGMMTQQGADLMRQWHPLRAQYELLSDANPLMAPIATMAESIRHDRKSAAQDNPFIALQENISRQIVTGLNAWRDFNEMVAERTFLSIYGSPTLQAAVGVDLKSSRPQRKASKNPLHKRLLDSRIAELKAAIGKGGVRECIVRAALYVGIARGSVDERGFEIVRRIRAVQDDLPRLTLPEFKTLVRDQYFMLMLDEQTALAAIPKLLPASQDERRKALALVRQVLSARGEIAGEAEKRMNVITRLFSSEQAQPNVASIAARESSKEEAMFMAS